VRAAGADAVRTVATEPWKLLGDTVAQVVRLVGSNDGRTLRSVAVIVPDDSGWLEEIGRHLDAADGITEQEREAVSVLAARQVKGMEYDHVLVVEPATIADRGPAGLRQLYIALTRSTQSLTILHTAPLPGALTDTGGGPAEPRLRVTEPDAEPDAESDSESDSGTGTDSGTDSESVPAAESGIPAIGSDVRIRVVGHTTGGNYRVEAISPAMDRPLLMAVRHGSAPPTAGAELDAWVLRHLSGVSFVTVDERGRRPISPTMAPRYAAALGVVAELAGGSVPDDFRPRLSELKGMANRCLRLDQHDWLDVWRVLGSPDRSRLNALRDLAAHRVPAAGSPDLDRFRAELERSGWAEDLDKARRTIEARIHAATGPVTEDRLPVSRRENPVPAEPPEPFESSETPPPSEPEEAEPMTTTTAAPAAPEKTESSTGLPQLLATSAAADRTCKTHEAVRFELKAALLRADRQPEPEHPVVDVACVTDEEHLLYEVLGAGLTSYADLRSGAARLREINHALAVGADRLCLVLAGPPAEEWAPVTVHDVFGVHVLWRTPQQSWDGQDVAAALGGGRV